MRDPPAPVRRGGTRLVGRDAECGRLDELLAAVCSGHSRALLIHGEPGVGKTALLDYFAGRASAAGCQMFTGTGVQSEMELPFASLHQLFAPLLDRLGAIPAPQQAALLTTFGLTSGPAPDRFLVGLALLSLLSEAAADVPLVCIVDDAHWLDRASAQVLAFAARRLGSESVGVVVGARLPTAEMTSLPEMVVAGLREEDARTLLGSVFRVPLDARVRDQVVAETRGNPLGLLELSRGITAGEMAGGFGLPMALGLPATIEESFRARAECLPPDARRLLLLAAAESTGDAALLWRAAGRLGISGTAAQLAEDADLVVFGVRVRFRHPLVRSAVYKSASHDERQAAHRALADAIDPEHEPDHHAWHRAQAVFGLDEDVATELERSAGRAQSRGGMAAAAAFLERSAELTGDPVRRFERMLAAADADVQAGAFGKARELLAAAEAGALDERASARVDLLRGQVAFASRAGSEAPGLLLKAARRMEPVDVALARQTYLDAWNAAWFAGRFALAGSLREVSSAALAAPPPPDPPRPSDALLDALAALVVDGRTRAAPALREVARRFAEGAITAEEWLRWGWIAVSAAVVLWDEERSYAILTRGLQSAREAGLLAHLPIYVSRLSINATCRGDFAAAGSLAAESDAIVAETGTSIASYATVFLAVHQGFEVEAFRLIDRMSSDTTHAGQGLGVQWCQLSSAILYNSLGRYEEAFVQAEQASEQTPEMHISSWALPELIEAAARVGRSQRAAEALDQLAESARAGAMDWGLGLEARSRALLSDGAAAEALYLEAIERFGRTRLRPELARSHLLFGEWLRRENRRTDARHHLRSAHKALTAIGMDAFAERARRELAATGETVRKRTTEATIELTPQELQIAQLATEGRTNVEIGTQLFLSRRTVEWHLGKVFTKLNITSRRELRDRLARPRLVGSLP